MANDISVRLGVDGEAGFKSAISAVSAEIRALDTGLKNAVSAMG